MQMTDHLPETGSLAYKMCVHLRAHPGDALPAARLPRLFNVRDPITAAQALRPALLAKLLRCTGSGADAVYEAGANLADTPLEVFALAAQRVGAAPRTGTPAKTTKDPRGGHRTRLPALDLDAIPVRTNVPLPAKHIPGKGDSQYARLIEAKLQQAGHMIELPIEYHGTILKATNTWAKTHADIGAQFKVRKTGPTTCGVWRIK